MRKVKITKDLKDNVVKFNKELFVETRSDSFELPINRLTKLKNNSSFNYKKYVKKIIDNYQDILNADPIKMKGFIEEFNKILKPHELQDKRSVTAKSFHEKVVYAMRYEELRSEEFPKYLLNSDLRTCVYCNSQSTLVVEPVYYNKKKKKGKKKPIAKLQLDHYYPKSKYPFLSTTFFNLYPTCANCNLSKGKKEAKFQLYTLGDDLDVFRFWIDDQSILDYWLNLDLKSLKIYLETVDGDMDLIKNHNDLFNIQQIYDAQKDIGEELVWKHKAYPNIYRHLLNKSFNKIFPDQSVIDRMLIGNYSKPEETFKRPLAKYTQDIARQLKIISENE
ncbi:HNH endonuclease [Bizionia hallyeonensis]|uniref:HNH endonuclease n=1 Tax=Bizionia hallyeonensis TaxID=1123757 RepID=A0ABW0C585_9FLAO